MNKDEFIINELGSHDTIDLKRAYIDLAGDLLAGVMLSQLIYWHLPSKKNHDQEKLRVFHEGQLWLAKERKHWRTECRITPKQVDRAIDILTGKAGQEANEESKYPKEPLIEVKLFKFAGAPTLHFRILWENFLPKYEVAARLVAEEMGFVPESDIPQTVKSESVNLPKGENGIVPNSKIKLPKMVKSLTEITTETNTKATDIYPSISASNPSLPSKAEIEAIIKLGRSKHPPDAPTAAAKTRVAETEAIIAPYRAAFLEAYGVEAGDMPKKDLAEMAEPILTFLGFASKPGAQDLAACACYYKVLWKSQDFVLNNALSALRLVVKGYASWASERLGPDAVKQRQAGRPGRPQGARAVPDRRAGDARHYGGTPEDRERIKANIDPHEWDWLKTENQAQGVGT